MAKPPKATLVQTSSARTLWRIDWPSTTSKWGKTYFAYTYPDSELVSIETAAKRRPVAAIQGRKILPEIKAAIATALAGSK